MHAHSKNRALKCLGAYLPLVNIVWDEGARFCHVLRIAQEHGAVCPPVTLYFIEPALGPNLQHLADRLLDLVPVERSTLGQPAGYDQRLDQLMLVDHDPQDRLPAALPSPLTTFFLAGCQHKRAAPAFRAS